MTRAATDYTAFITGFHKNRTKFIATVTQTLAGFDNVVGVQSALLQTSPAFDLDTAIGVQLDVDGQWIGQSRFIPTPLPDPWFRFSLPTAPDRRGWGVGIWKGPFDFGNLLNRLGDDVYRKLLFAKIISNTWDGTVSGALAAYLLYFNDSATLISVQDNGDMTEYVGVSGKWPDVVSCFILQQNLIPVKPIGVTTKYFFTSINNTPLFGFGVQNNFISGWGTGTWGTNAEFVQANTTFGSGTAIIAVSDWGQPLTYPVINKQYNYAAMQLSTWWVGI